MGEKLTVLVTPRSLSKGQNPAVRLLQEAGITVLTPWPGRQPERDELLGLIGSCDGYLAGVEPIDAQVLERAGRLKVISRNGVGTDTVDLEYAGKLGIEVVGTPGANSQGVAELALTLMLDGIRSIAYSNDQLKAGRWARKKGKEVQGRTLGIIGCGQIGRRLARMAIGIGMEVVGYDMYPDEGLSSWESFRYLSSIEEVLRLSDVISLHCPPAERPLINATTLAMMRPGVLLVNTARSGLVDSKALTEALKEGKVAGYCCDVFDTEPPEIDELLAHEAVTITPHIGGFTEESVDRAALAAAENILRVLK